MQYCIFNYSYHAVITSPWLICFTRMKAYEFQIWVSRDLTDFPCASWSYRPVISMQGSWVSLLWRQLSILLLELSARCLNEPIVHLSIHRTPLWMQPCKWACVKQAKESSDHLTELWEFFFLSHYILRWLILQQKVTNALSKEGFPSERFSCKYCVQILFRSHTLCSGLNCVPLHPKCTCLSSF